MKIVAYRRISVHLSLLSTAYIAQRFLVNIQCI